MYVCISFSLFEEVPLKRPPDPTQQARYICFALNNWSVVTRQMRWVISENVYTVKGAGIICY